MGHMQWRSKYLLPRPLEYSPEWSAALKELLASKGLHVCEGTKDNHQEDNSNKDSINLSQTPQRPGHLTATGIF